MSDDNQKPLDQQIADLRADVDAIKHQFQSDIKRCIDFIQAAEHKLRALRFW